MYETISLYTIPEYLLKVSVDVKFGILLLIILALPLASALTVQISIPTPDSNGYFTQDFTVFGSTDEGPVDVNFSLDSTFFTATPISDTNYSASISLGSLREETVTLQVNAQNGSDNASVGESHSVQITIDTLPPDINAGSTNINVSNASLNAVVRISVDVTDAYIGYVQTVVGSVINNLTDTGSLWQIDESPANLGCADGSNCTITIEAYDEAGNKDNLDLVLEVGTPQGNPPPPGIEITILKPVNRTVEYDSTIELSFEVIADSVPTNNNVFCKYELNFDPSGETKEVGNYFAVDFAGTSVLSLDTEIEKIEDASYILKITCYDAQAKSYTTEVNFVLFDTTAPETYVDILELEETSIKFTVNSSEEFKIKDVEYRVTGDSNISSATTTDEFGNLFEFIITGLEPASDYVLQVKGVDRAGDSTDRDQNEFVSTETFRTKGGTVVDKDVSASKTSSQSTTTKLSDILEGEVYSHGIDWLRKGESLSVTVTNFDLIVREIILESREDVRNIKLDVVAGQEPPKSMVGNFPSESDVYYYFSIDAENLPDSKTKTAQIRFEVNQIWLRDSGVSLEDVAVFRYHEGKWNELPTNLIKQGALTHVFETLSPGFSLFAIAEKVLAEKKVVEQEEGIIEEPVEEVTEDIIDTEEKKEQINWFKMTLIGLGILLGIFVVIFIASALKNRKPREKIDHKSIKGNMKKVEKFVDHALSHGHSKEEVRDSLLKGGWDERIVDFVLRRK
uniref:PKD domain-containing protein n=1 Tax=uncultured marine group II/III euryarchaeote KM3_83_G03 TaxID=1456522 RepID=A0A075HVU6_9EURY|nr:PKD domain-containing protein [uncultured marine group II/III euryarchaeote KM3_83_G03]